MRRRALISVIVVLLCLRAGVSCASASSTRLDTLIQDIRSEVQPDQATEIMWRVYSTDRWFNFTKSRETAGYLSAAMQQAGLQQIAIGSPPADGISEAGF